MRFGIITGLLCIGISLGLLYLGDRVDSLTDYFKGAILGLGAGLFVGNLYGYFKGINSGKRSAMKKIEEGREKPRETALVPPSN